MNIFKKFNNFLRKYSYGLIGVAAIGFFTMSHFTSPSFTTLEYSSELAVEHTEAQTQIEQKTATETAETVPDTREAVMHQPLPKPVRSIYMTSCVVGTPSFRERLVQLIQQTELNAVVIDIKDFSGTLSFKPLHESWLPAWQNTRCGALDMKSFIESLHQKGIYVMARITVFQDPFYTKMHPDLAVMKADGVTVWKDFKGLSFIDVGSREYWDRIVELSADAYNIGFDELNFDYVRYPSDGPMTDISFPHSYASEYGHDKQANLEAFFKYLNEKLDDPSLYSMYHHVNTGRATATPYTSVDLFGMTTTNYDDLSIGQVQDRAAPYFDFVCPMVYPSHYPNSFLNLGNPNDHPYTVVNYAMQTGVNRMTSSTTPMQGFLHTPIMTTNASGTQTFTGLYKKPVYTADKFRTWVQDFDYGGDYDANDVRSEIQASYDAGVKSFMIWAPSNIYTKAALFPASSTQMVQGIATSTQEVVPGR